MNTAPPPRASPAAVATAACEVMPVLSASSSPEM